MNLHVGNLPVDLTEPELRSVFEPFGVLESLEIITNQRTGEPMGYAFVVMQNEEDGMRAIASLNATALKGKVVTVAAAHRPHGRRKGSFKKPRPR